MRPVSDVQAYARRGELEMRRVNASPLSRIHAVPSGMVSAVCGFSAAGGWIAQEAPPIDAVACRQCRNQLRRAGFELVRGSLCALREEAP